MRRTAKEAIAALATLAVHESRVLPRVGRELAGWRGVAAAVPDPRLRDAALAALTEKASNVEAVAVFATLAPARDRPAVVRAVVALQVAIDYLDNLGERPGPDPLRDGLQLHRSLATAFVSEAERGDWYAHHPQREDGGYLDSLLEACREAFASLPSHTTVEAPARAAALRCGEGQSHTHAAVPSSAPLREWASRLAAPAGFEWWEAAAGASSSVAAHALIALAADAEASPEEAVLVEAAYFPAIGALTVLLDDLVDREADARFGEHNYLDYYGSTEVAAERLTSIVGLARAALPPLPRSARHAAILAGVLAFYLSSPGARTPFATTIRARLLRAGGPLVRALASILRLRGND
ncbi:MAG: tetraprenyl-beta-curcumene synthase [Solirubrobacterales bacterium]|nr:tetraprenyl-beta-curcumene synthase [Solirubrobacterales bacterium]